MSNRQSNELERARTQSRVNKEESIDPILHAMDRRDSALCELKRCLDAGRHGDAVCAASIIEKMVRSISRMLDDAIHYGSMVNRSYHE